MCRESDGHSRQPNGGATNCVIYTLGVYQDTGCESFRSIILDIIFGGLVISVVFLLCRRWRISFFFHPVCITSQAGSGGGARVHNASRNRGQEEETPVALLAPQQPCASVWCTRSRGFTRRFCSFALPRGGVVCTRSKPFSVCAATRFWRLTYRVRLFLLTVHRCWRARLRNAFHTRTPPA